MRVDHRRWITLDSFVLSRPSVLVRKTEFEGMTIYKTWNGAQVSSKLCVFAEHAMRLNVDTSRISGFKHHSKNTGMDSTSLQIALYLVEGFKFAATLQYRLV